MDDIRRVELLKEIGLSANESAVYLELIKESPQTGYKIAEKIGKSRSNTYQALRSLEKNGYINLLEGGSVQEYIPIPIDQLLSYKERELKRRSSQITEAFADIRSESGGNQIYNIKSLDQLISKAEEMIDLAEDIIIIDSSKKPIKHVEKRLVGAAKRGVKVLIQSIERIEIEGCRNVINSGDFTDLDPWGVDWLSISVDSEKTIISYLKQSGDLINALWIDNIYLSNWIANGSMYESLFRYLINQLKSGVSREEIWDSVDTFYKHYLIKTKGDKSIVDLMRQYRGS
jgi:sugar-specific transcriptional regulator TrmB